MKVRILRSIASAKWSYAYGDIVDLDDELAAKWIASGIAEPAQAFETAVKEPAEKAVRKTAKRR